MAMAMVTAVFGAVTTVAAAAVCAGCEGVEPAHHGVSGGKRRWLDWIGLATAGICKLLSGGLVWLQLDR